MAAAALALAALLADGAAAQAQCAGKQYPGSCFSCPSSGCQQLARASGVGSPDACCAACAANPKCDLWTLQSHTQMCYLKTRTGAGPAVPKACANGTAGAMAPRSPPPPAPPPPAPTPLPPAPPGGFKSVLFIMVDDLRPEIGACERWHSPPPPRTHRV